MRYIRKREIVDAVQAGAGNFQKVVLFLSDRNADFELKRKDNEYDFYLYQQYIPIGTWLVAHRDPDRIATMSDVEFKKAFDAVPETHVPDFEPTQTSGRVLDIRSLRPAQITLGALTQVSDKELSDRFGAMLTTCATDGPRSRYGITSNGYACKKNHNGHLAILTGLPDDWSVLLTETGEKAFEKFYVSEGLAVFEMP